MPFCQQVHFTHSYNISKWHPRSRAGGEGGRVSEQKWFVTLKSSFTIYEKEDVRLSLKHQLYKCLYSWLQLLSNRWYRGIELSKCVYSFHGCKNRTYSWRSKLRCFQNAYLMVMSAKTLAATKVKISKMYALFRRNIMIYTEISIKLIFVTNSVVFVI